MPKVEKRLKKRVRAELEISFIHDEDYLISYSKDISADGMFIRTENPPPVGDTIKMKFSIGNHDSITIDAKVVWTNTSGSLKDFGMGVKFIKPSVKVKNTILEIVKRIAILEKYEKA